MKPTYIIGHKNPDTDSIMASICYGDFKKQIGEEGIVSARLGDINAESRFVIDRYGLEEPKLIKSVKTQVKDLNYEEIHSVRENTPVKQIWETLNSNGLGSMPVIDEQGKLAGIVSLSDIARFDTSLVYNNEFIVDTTVENVLSTLSAIKVCGNGEEVCGRVVVAENKNEIDVEGAIVIVNYEEGIEELAAKSSANLVILAKGVEAKKYDDQIATNTVATPLGIFKVARLISQSVPVKNVMTKAHHVVFGVDEVLDDVKETIASTRYKNFPVVNEEGIVVGMISRNHLIKYDKKKLILVDHNELSQTVNGIEQAVVTEVIDHHRLANLETAGQLYMRCEPVGSSNTIIANMYKERGLVPSKEIAGAMLCAILSDTVLFKSPTCTTTDIEVANELAKIAGEDIEELGNDLFTAGSTLVNEGAVAMVNKDFKEFNLAGKRIGVGQITIWDTDLVKPAQAEIKEVMNGYIKDGFDVILFMETSIKKEGTLLVCAGDYEAIVDKAFGKKCENDEVYLEGVMSRKKQIIPPVTAALV